MNIKKYNIFIYYNCQNDRNKILFPLYLKLNTISTYIFIFSLKIKTKNILNQQVSNIF